MDLEERKQKEFEESRRWAAKWFGIPIKDVAGYNGGICYSTCWVRSEKAAKKVAKKVAGETANGGYFHGMPLGGITEEVGSDGSKVWRVTC
jgi:hypothetical protein